MNRIILVPSLFPGLITYQLEVAIQCGFFILLFGHADAAEPEQVARVDGLKGQLFISESDKGFHDNTAQQFVDTHAFGAGAMGSRLAPVRILQHIPTGGRVSINDGTDDSKLLALGLTRREIKGQVCS